MVITSFLQKNFLFSPSSEKSTVYMNLLYIPNLFSEWYYHDECMILWIDRESPSENLSDTLYECESESLSTRVSRCIWLIEWFSEFFELCFLNSVCYRIRNNTFCFWESDSYISSWTILDRILDEVCDDVLVEFWMCLYDDFLFGFMDLKREFTISFENLLRELHDFDWFLFLELLLGIRDEEESIDRLLHRTYLLTGRIDEPIFMRQCENLEIRLHDGKGSLEFMGDIMIVCLQRTIVLSNRFDHDTSQNEREWIDDDESYDTSKCSKKHEPSMEFS